MKPEIASSNRVAPLSAADAKIGFIGAGAMGVGMITNLRKNGFDVTFFARSTARGRENATRLLALGARQAETLGALGGAVQVVILCLPDSPTVEAMLADEAGLVGALPSGAIVLDCSTSHPDSTRRLSARLAAKGIVLLDSPLTGSRAQADAGVLSVLGAGPKEAFDRAVPVMKGFAAKVFYLGNSGAGHTAKLINNFLAQIAMAGLCETWPLMEQYGVDPQALFDAVSASGGNSAVFQGVFPRFRKGDFTLNFAQRLACKDIRYVNELTSAARFPSPLAAALLSVHEHATARGYGDQDMTALLRYYDEIRRAPAH